MNTHPLAHPQILRRRSFLAPIWAAARSQARYVIMNTRQVVLVVWPTALVEMLLVRQLWVALFAGQAVFDGYTLDQTLTYVVLSMAITNLLRQDTSEYLHWRIRSGNILFELMYPLHFPMSLLASELSSLAILLLTLAAPLLFMAVFILNIALPATPLNWLMFAVSFFLGYLIMTFTDILIGLLGFWTTEIDGLVAWKGVIVGILSGALLPLWIYPDAIERVISYFPFRGIQYVPLSILVGWIGPDAYLYELAVQGMWVVLLVAAIEAVYYLARRQMQIQGG